MITWWDESHSKKALGAIAVAFNVVGGFGEHHPDFGTREHIANIAGHAAVGCLSSVASGGKCGSGAPLIRDAFPDPQGNLDHLAGGTVASGVLAGLASVAGGGKFANGAETAAFGYLFNNLRDLQKTSFGTALGATAGVTVAASCNLATALACVIANPGIVLGGITVGIVGGFIGDTLESLNILNIKPPDNAWDPNGPKAPGYPGDPETGHPDYADPKRRTKLGAKSEWTRI